MEKVVHCHVFNPKNTLFKQDKNTKAECKTVICSNSENCDLLKRGMCARLPLLFGSAHCPYGKSTREVGYTPRASKFYQWIRQKEKENEGVPKLSTYSSDIMAKVGDYVFLSYSFMNMCKEVPFSSHGSFMASGSNFLNIEDFNAENVIKLINFRPHALMGGEITDYQKTVVPKFVIHLREEFPDLFEEVFDKNEKVQKIIEEYTNVGRKALLNTVNKNVGTFKDIHGGEWSWDGEYLTCTNRATTGMIIWKEIEETRIKPKKESIDKIEVKISDEKQVNENTVFLD